MSDTNATRAAPRAEALISRLEQAGCRRVHPPVLQPAGVFLDVSGEDLRRRMFLTQGPDGHELCLRPDLTIPTARLHLAADAAPARYCYLGTVFRHRGGDSSEFLQGGIELFGHSDRPQADAEVILRAAEGVASFGVSDAVLRLGDLELLGAMLDAIGIPEAWKRRLLREAARGGDLDAQFTALLAGRDGNGQAGFLAALDGANHEAARAVVSDLIAIAGISTVGGRSVGDIADRFLEQARLSAGIDVPDEKRKALSRFLAIEGDLASATLSMRTLAADAGLALGAALDAFEARNLALRDGGLDMARVSFAARFGRPLGYYTGLVFELHSSARPDLGVLAGGGRYDRLMETLGASTRIPAVGCAFWIERLAEAAA